MWDMMDGDTKVMDISGMFREWWSHALDADVVKVPNVCSHGDDFRIFGCSKTMLDLRDLELSNHLWLALLKPQVL